MAVVCVAELFNPFGSDVPLLATVAVLLIVVPAEVWFGRTTSVIVSLLLPAVDVNVPGRLFPAPPHTPTPEEAHETKVTSTGRLAVIVPDVAASGLLLVTPIL